MSFTEPARYIKIAIDRPLTNTVSMKRDPFILRLSGVNGSIITLRADGIVH